MSAILLGVLPVFAMIALGWGLKASRFIPEISWPPIERITYFVFYPGFLMPAVWKADFGSLSAGPLALGAVGGMATVALAVLLAKPLIRLPDASYTSVFQGALRWNTFVFLPLAALVFGKEGAGLAAMIMGALIPAINVVCVLVMSRWGEGQGGGLRTALRGLTQNPVLWGCAVGALFNVLHVPKLPVVMSTLDLLSAAAPYHGAGGRRGRPELRLCPQPPLADRGGQRGQAAGVAGADVGLLPAGGRRRHGPGHRPAGRLGARRGGLLRAGPPDGRRRPADGRNRGVHHGGQPGDHPAAAGGVPRQMTPSQRERDS